MRARTLIPILLAAACSNSDPREATDARGPGDPDAPVVGTAASAIGAPPATPASIGGERDADAPIAATTGRNATAPAIAFDGTNYLVVWADQRDTSDSADADIWGVRVSQAGAILDATGIQIAAGPGAQTNPTVAYDGARFVIAWEDYRALGSTSADIAVATVSPGGAVVNLGAVAATSASETKPALAGNGSGALLAWVANNQIVVARESGGAFGAALAVTSNGNAHTDPAIAAAPSGDYLVAYTETTAATGADVRGQLVTSAGALHGAAFDIDAGAGAQQTPDASFDGTNYDVVWSNNKNGIFTYGARVSPAGVVLDTHAETSGSVTSVVGGTLLDNTSNGETQPTIACAAGGCVVVWQDRRNGATTDLYGRALSTSFVPGAALVAAQAPFAQAAPELATGAGGFFAVWQDQRSSTITVAGARIAVGGAVADPNGIPLAAGYNQETAPAAARAGTSVGVGWSDSRGAWGDDIEALRFDATGAPIDSSVIAVSAATYRQSAVAAAGFGANLIYAWTDTRNGGDYDIYAARVSASTGAVLDPAGIAIAAVVNDQIAPAVASSGNEALVVWQAEVGTTYDVYGAIVGPNGTVTVPAFAISNASGDEITPAVAWSATANQYIVAWVDSRAGANARDLYAARVTPAGVLLDSTGVLVATGTGGRFNPKLAASTAGDSVLAVFEDQRSGNRDIYGARLTGGNALTVLDASGIAICTEASKQQQPTVAATSSGWIAAWSDPRSAATKGDIWGQFVGTGGGLVGANFAISQNPEDETAPSLVDATTTRALVSYRKQRTDLHTGRVETRTIDTSPQLVSIAVTPASSSIPKGATQTYTATGTYSDGTTADVTASAAFASSNTAVATMAGNVATGVAVGTTTITATVGTVSGSATLTVDAATLVSIAVTPANPSIAKGTTRAFTAIGTFSDGTTDDITATSTFTSSNAAVATMSGNVATGVAVGTTTITATKGAVSGSTTLTVTAAALVSIAVTPANPSIAKGTTQAFTATGTYTDGTTQNVTASATWVSTDTAVATVTGNVAKGVGVGTTTIRATVGTVSGSTTLTVTAATLASIAVTPANPSIAKGLTQTFTATGTYTDGTTENLTGSATWTSSNTAVATMTNNVAKGVGVGTTTIRAAVGTLSGTTTLTVTAATLVSIAVTPASSSIAKGTTQTFTATGTYTDGTTQNVTAAATWTSSNTAVATVSGNVATGVGTGTATIRATVGTVSGAATLTVTAATLVSITVTPANPSIPKGATQAFTATGMYTDGTTENLTGSATWSSSNTAVATMTNNVAKGVGVGTTTIRATVGTVSGTTTLTVTQPVLASIAVTPANASIAKGLTQTFTATGTYTDGTTQNVTAAATWTSSNPAVATMSGNVATGVGVGTTTIRATVGAVSGTATLAVTAAQLVSIAVTPANPSIAKGLTQAFAATGTYTDGTTQDLTGSVGWRSSNTAVATMTANVARGVGVGTSTISADLGTVSGSTTLTVTPAALVSIAVTPANASIAKGLTQAFTATGTYTDGTTQNLTASATWTSSDTTVATLANNVATGVGVGTATITATVGAISGSTTLTVTPPAIVSIAVTPANSSAPRGVRVQLTATATYSDGTTADVTTTATWASSNTAVATISNAAGTQGQATTIAAGFTNITATVGAVTGTTRLTVTSATLVSIAITPAGTFIPRNTTQQLTATGRFSDNSTLNLTTQVTWTSSDPSSATVSSTGLLTAIAFGIPTIRATLGTVSGTAQYLIF